MRRVTESQKKIRIVIGRKRRTDSRKMRGEDSDGGEGQKAGGEGQKAGEGQTV